MLATLSRTLFGTKNSRELKRMGKVVAQINALEPRFEAMGGDALKAFTEKLRERYGAGETLDALLPEAFAAVREAARRTKELRHFDEQLIGGIILHEGRIAEMKTGEGKTLMATLAAYLNALGGRGVHIVTVNDYLARRDAVWMGPIYEALGLAVGVVQSGQNTTDKRAAYQADVTYGTNNEFGFDYLRDNMAFTLKDRFQKELHYAIVDEVDSILIDEARTPLIISGPAEQSTELYKHTNRLALRLKREIPGEGPDAPPQVEGDFVVDEKNRQVELTERGHVFVEAQLVKMGLLEEHDSLYAASNLNLLHHLNAAMRAHALFKRDVDYMVADGQVVIVDEHTGRAMTGRRWSEGLHQAVEAKEGVAIQNESQTLASTTFQNYFRLFEKLAGMTGTADTEAFEFRQIYNLDVVVIPTHMPMVRQDHNDLVYLTIDEKYDAIVEDITDCMARGQPVAGGYGLHRLVGTPFPGTEETQDSTQRPKRQTARARGRHHCPGGQPGRGHHCHQYGGPRHRYRVGRQLGGRSRKVEQSRGIRSPGAEKGLGEAPRASRRGRWSAHYRHRAARKPTHRQPTARALRSPGRPGLFAFFFFPWKTICCASSPPNVCVASCSPSAWKRARRSSIAWSTTPSSERSARWRAATSIRVSRCWNSMT